MRHKKDSRHSFPRPQRHQAASAGWWYPPHMCHLTLSHSRIVSAGGCHLGVPIFLRVTLLHSFHRRHLISTHHLQRPVLVYPELSHRAKSKEKQLRRTDMELGAWSESEGCVLVIKHDKSVSDKRTTLLRTEVSTAPQAL